MFGQSPQVTPPSILLQYFVLNSFSTLFFGDTSSTLNSVLFGSNLYHSVNLLSQMMKTYLLSVNHTPLFSNHVHNALRSMTGKQVVAIL